MNKSEIENLISTICCKTVLKQLSTITSLNGNSYHNIHINVKDNFISFFNFDLYIQYSDNYISYFIGSTTKELKSGITEDDYFQMTLVDNNLVSYSHYNKFIKFCKSVLKSIDFNTVKY